MALAVGSTVLVACLVYVLRTFSWGALGEVLLDTDLVLFIVGGVLTILMYWALRTLRWMVLMKEAFSTASFAEFYMMTALSAGLASVTPFQSGEAGKVEWLKMKGRLDRPAGYSAFAVERLLDLAVVSVFGLVGVGVLAVGEATLRWIVVALVISVVGSVVLLRAVDMRRRFGRWFANVQLLVRDAKTLAIAAALTLTCWLVVALGWWVSLASVSITLDLREAVGIVGLVTLVNILSIVPWALGIFEVSTSAFLAVLGEPPVAAQAGAVILRGYAILVLLVAAAHLLFAASMWKGLRAIRASAKLPDPPNQR